MKFITSVRQQKRLVPQILNAAFMAVVVVFVMSGSLLAQRRRPAAPAKPASTQTYSCVPFEEVKEKDFGSLIKQYPFLEDDIPDAASLEEDRKAGSRSTEVLISDLNQTGIPRIVLVYISGANCGASYCALNAYMDGAVGFKQVLGGLTYFGSPVYISRNHLSLLTYSNNHKGGTNIGEWRFKNGEFDSLGKPGVFPGLPKCEEHSMPIWNAARAKPIASLLGRIDLPKTPDGLVAALYDPKTEEVFQAESRVPLDKYFDKEFADLIWKELLRWKSDDPIESFDYVLYNFGYGNGDVDNSKPIIGKPVLSDGKTQVNVTYNIYVTYPVRKYSDRETIQFFLVEEKPGWRITDIRYDGKFAWCVKGKKLSLFDMYSMDAKASEAERTLWNEKNGSEAQGYKDYLRIYPNGAYAAAARAKLQEIETAKVRSVPAGKPATSKHGEITAVGTLVSNESGTEMGDVCLKIAGKEQCFEWYSKVTKWSPNFRTNGDAWEIGAEWRITYAPKDMILSSATFTGHSSKANDKLDSKQPVKSPTDEGVKEMADPATVELRDWEAIKDSTNPEDFKAFLAKYPNGRLAALARSRAEPVKPVPSPVSAEVIAAERARNTHVFDVRDASKTQGWLTVAPGSVTFEPKKQKDGNGVTIQCSDIKHVEQGKSALGIPHVNLFLTAASGKDGPVVFNTYSGGTGTIGVFVTGLPSKPVVDITANVINAITEACKLNPTTR